MIKSERIKAIQQDFALHLTLVANTTRHLRDEMREMNSRMGSILKIHEHTDQKISAWGSVLNNTEVYGQGEV